MKCQWISDRLLRKTYMFIYLGLSMTWLVESKYLPQHKVFNNQIKLTVEVEKNDQNKKLIELTTNLDIENIDISEVQGLVETIHLKIDDIKNYAQDNLNFKIINN